jgi:hypothetical protein
MLDAAVCFRMSWLSGIERITNWQISRQRDGYFICCKFQRPSSLQLGVTKFVRAHTVVGTGLGRIHVVDLWPPLIY